MRIRCAAGIAAVDGAPLAVARGHAADEAAGRGDAAAAVGQPNALASVVSILVKSLLFAVMRDQRDLDSFVKYNPFARRPAVVDECVCAIRCAAGRDAGAAADEAAAAGGREGAGGRRGHARGRARRVVGADASSAKGISAASNVIFGHEAEEMPNTSASAGLRRDRGNGPLPNERSVGRPRKRSTRRRLAIRQRSVSFSKKRRAPLSRSFSAAAAGSSP